MKLTSIILSVFIAVTAAAAPLEIDRAAAAMAGQEASFTHRFTPKGFKTSQTETGTVKFGPAPKMRWDYVKPETKVFVFDGTKSWFFVPADKQVTVGTITDQRKRELPFLLLGDPAARDKHFVVKEKSSGGRIVTTFQPRDAKALMKSVAVTVNPKTHLIQRIEYVDRDGNRTSFDFSGYHPQRSTEGYQFAVPAGVQTISAD